MYDDLTSFEHKPIPKICKHLNKFEKSQKFSKTPNFRSKDMKCMIKG